MDKMTRTLLKTIYVLFVAIVLLLASGVPGLAAAATVDDASFRTVRVGYFKFDGYHMLDDQGQRSGYGYDVLQMLGRYNNWDYVYVGYDESWDDMLRLLRTGEIDMVTSAQRTPGREREFGFSSVSIGSSATELSVRAGDTRFVPGDYSTYNGIIVGMLRDNSRNGSFARFAASKGFTYESVYFEDADALQKALREDETIDAIVTSNLRLIHDEWILDQFDPSPFYVITRKGDTQLLAEVNQAINKMDMNMPGWRNVLMSKYYLSDHNVMLALSAEERRHLQQMKELGITIKVLVSPDRAPLSYFEQGQAKGILVDVFDRIAALTGIPYEYIHVADLQEYNAYVKSGQADVIVGVVDNFSLAEQRNLKLTDPFMTTELGRVTLKTFSGEVKRVAITAGTINEKLLQDSSLSEPPQVYATRDACIDAVISGKADATYINYFIAQKYLHDDYRNTLQVNVLPKTQMRLAIGVSKQEDVHVLSILNKGVNSIRGTYVQEMVLKNTDYGSRPFSLMGVIYENPMPSIGIVILLAIIIAGLIIAVHRAKLEKGLRLHEEEQHQILGDALETARHASEAKSAFMSRVSHEIRTPLNAIIGYMLMARKAMDDPDRLVHYVDNTSIAARHLLNVINDVLDISSIESGRMKIAFEVFNLKKLIGDEQVLFENLAKEKGVTLVMDDAGVTYPQVVGDPMRVRQILTNILSNAVKFTLAGGYVSLTAMQIRKDSDRTMVKFKIADTGIGMSEEYKKRMYQPFEQESAKTAQQFGGTGLGLSITNNLVNMMGGSIEVESTIGEGTTFCVTLPFKMAGSGEADEGDLGQPVSDTKLVGLRVLLAEDNPMNQEIATTILREAGLIVTTADDGAEVVRQFESSQEGQYQCILMDIQMPLMNGYEATKHIRSSKHPQAQTIPIIAVTADAFAEDVSRALACGMNDYITKPIEYEKLFLSLQKIMN